MEGKKRRQNAKIASLYARARAAHALPPKTCPLIFPYYVVEVLLARSCKCENGAQYIAKKENFLWGKNSQAAAAAACCLAVKGTIAKWLEQ